MTSIVRTYFDGTGHSAFELAQKIGVSPSTITRALRGERQPSFKLAQDIETATGGKITAKGFIEACMDAEKHRNSSPPSNSQPVEAA